MKKNIFIVLIVIAVFVFMGNQDQDKDQNDVEYENEHEYEVYIKGQKDAIKEIRITADECIGYVELEQLQDVLSDEVGDDMRDVIISYLTIYDEPSIVEGVISDSGYDEYEGYVN